MPAGARKNIATGTPWEPMVGYSRAVRVGNLVFVSGTTGTDANGNIVDIDDPEAQTRQALRNIERALVREGATLKDVVRTRVFVKKIKDWEEIGKVHGEFFKDIRPGSTLVQVAGFVDPRMLVEIEADAVVDEPRPTAI